MQYRNWQCGLCLLKKKKANTVQYTYLKEKDRMTVWKGEYPNITGVIIHFIKYLYLKFMLVNVNEVKSSKEACPFKSNIMLILFQVKNPFAAKLIMPYLSFL